MEAIEVSADQNFDLPLSRISRESVVKKEILVQERIKHKNAVSLARAVDLEPGVQTTLTCANCGSQRITLNGLRGENTVVMIDGVPAFSSVSSFYGMEAIPMAGVGSIEIMRGAGSALTAPEAIGGVVNLVTGRTDKNSFSYLVRGGENQLFNQQLLGTYGDARGGILIAAQSNQMNYFDEDGNNVAESSKQFQKSLFFKKDNRFGDKLKVSARGGFQELELLGGVTGIYRPKTYPAVLADENDFRGGDVRNKFTGDPSKIADLIRLKRIDGSGSFVYHLNSEMNLKGSFSLAKQNQEAIYSHGYDYDNQDMFRFLDVRMNKLIGENHLVTLGVDNRNEEMSSSSEFLFAVNDFYRDSFEFDTLGIYLQDEWFISQKDELNLVMRFDRMKVDWQDKRLRTSKLDESIIAPRVHYKRIHSDEFSSRFSFGVGYRAPLTLFESQHGTNEEGFELNIKKIETAETFTYTLNYEAQKRSSAFSGSITRLRNMAYGDEETIPMEFKNASETMNIGTINFLQVEKVTPNWTIEASFDWFILPDSYKDKLPIAAQETRARLVSDYHFGKNELVGFLNLTGPQNLRKYNYHKNYNVRGEDPLTLESLPSSRKSLHAPFFYTIDLFFNRELFKNVNWILGVTNLLDYTQSKKESPLSWRMHGDHLHLDNRHIWGPNQGRVIYTGLKAEI